MGRFNDLSGKVFGKLIAIEAVGKDKSGGYKWKCCCDCGNELIVLGGNLSSGHTTSCGCNRITHNNWKDPAYNCYIKMINRTTDEANNRYEFYKGKGVKVCERWVESGGKGFLNFLEDMGPRPSTDHSIERIDVNGDYEPENCVWETAGIQAFNRTRLKSNTSGRTGVTWSNKRGLWISRISHKGIRYELYHGPSFEEACKVREEAELKYYGFIKG